MLGAVVSQKVCARREGEGVGGVRLPVAVVLLVSQHRNVLQRESHSQSDQQHRQEKPYKCLNTKMKPLLEEAFPVRLVNRANVIQTNHKKSDLVGWLLLSFDRFLQFTFCLLFKVSLSKRETETNVVRIIMFLSRNTR